MERPSLIILILFLEIMKLQCYNLTIPQYETLVLNGNYSTNITVTVDENKEYILHFPDSSSKYPYTVFIWSEKADINYPVLIMVRQQKEATSWEIPLLVKSRQGMLNFYSTARTLCHNNINALSEMPRNILYSSKHEDIYKLEILKRLSMSISTSSNVPTPVTIRVEEQEDFFVEENQNISFIISPSKPRYFYYRYSNKIPDSFQDTIILDVDSQDDTCLTVSIQDIACPVFDLNEDIEYEGEFETVDTRGGIIINEKDFPRGFFVVFVAKGDDYDCIQKGSFIPQQNFHLTKPLNRSSKVSFRIMPNISRSEYVVACLSTLLAIAGFYFIFLAVSCGLCSWENRCPNCQILEEVTRDEDKQALISGKQSDKEPENRASTSGANGNGIMGVTLLTPPEPSQRQGQQNVDGTGDSNATVIDVNSGTKENRCPNCQILCEEVTRDEDKQALISGEQSDKETKSRPSTSGENGNGMDVILIAPADSSQRRLGASFSDLYLSCSETEQNVDGTSDPNTTVIGVNSGTRGDMCPNCQILFEEVTRGEDKQAIISGEQSDKEPKNRPSTSGENGNDMDVILIASSDSSQQRKRQQNVDGTGDSNATVIDVNSGTIKEHVHYLFKKPKLYLSDLATKRPKHFQRESCNYFWHVLTVGIFYAVPVIQLAGTQQMVLHETGNLDICYYNFLCAHPLGTLSDFNHLFSNIAYLAAGFLFLIYTATILKRKYRKQKKDCGIPQHFGLYYAMSAALVMEGVLSACYHICPSKSNFQFDTSFMYVIAVLCIVKLYQNRHPDINITSYVTFTILAAAIIIVVVGILEGALWMWSLFITAYTLLSLYLGVRVYYVHHPRWGIAFFNKARKESGLCHALKPIKKGRYNVVVIATIANVIMVNLGYYCYSVGWDFPTFFLCLLMGNAVFYTAIYIIMKLINKEAIPIKSIIFTILAGCTWGGALYFFVKHSSEWGVTAAKSRERNTHCVLLNFYDDHDIWHALSATALFFSFMVLSTLDDKLLNKPRTKIPVF